MKILGLDQSLSASGLCLRNNDLPFEDVETTWNFQTGNPPRDVVGDDRFRWFHEWLLKILAGVRPDVLIYEGAASGAQGSKDILFELQGVVKATAYQWKATSPSLRIYSVNISHLKMFATGVGSGDKGPMLEAMARDFPDVQASNNDEVDAFWLTEVGAVVEKVRIATTPQQTYVAAVVRGDRDAAALKKELDREKGKRDRAAKKAAQSARENESMAHFRKWGDENVRE